MHVVIINGSPRVQQYSNTEKIIAAFANRYTHSSIGEWRPLENQPGDRRGLSAPGDHGPGGTPYQGNGSAAEKFTLNLPQSESYLLRVEGLRWKGSLQASAERYE